MPKKEKHENSNEINELKEYNLTIIEFILSICSEEDKKLILPFKNKIEEIAEQNYLRGMRVITKDMSEWARSMNNSEQQSLNSLLQLRLGKDLNTYRQLERIRRILNRGKINTLQEYTLLLSYFEEIQDEGLNSKDFMKLEEVLMDYQSRSGRM